MKKLEPFKRIILFVASIMDITLLTGCFLITWYRFYAIRIEIPFWNKGNWLVIALYALLLIFFSKMYGGLKISQLRKGDIIFSQLLSVIMVNGITYLQIALLSKAFINVTPLILMTGAETVVIILWGLLVGNLYQHLFRPWKLLFIHADRDVGILSDKIETRRDKYTIQEAIHVNVGMEAIQRKVLENEAVLLGDIPVEMRNDLLKYCYSIHRRVYVVPKISDIIMMGTERIHLFDTPLSLSRGYALTFDQALAKRCLDLILAILLLILTSPIMLITSAVIKFYDGGPIIYKQKRLTLDGKLFDIYKFRSMIVDAERDGVARLAAKSDTRITPFGNFIRQVRIDELPQLINIICGDMSFVGPRPERPEILEEYEREIPEFHFRMHVKAGLTGYAQIYGKYNTTPYDKLKLDLFYIENYSVWMDLKLLIMTVKILMKKESTEGIEVEREMR